jgi:hypothetical protein
VIDADRDRGTALLSPWSGAPRRRKVDAVAPDATHRERRALPTQKPETQHMKDDLENSPWVAANRELVEMGLVRDSGRRRDGMIVWELTPLGWELAKPRADRHARNTAPLISPPSVTDPLQLATLAIAVPTNPPSQPCSIICRTRNKIPAEPPRRTHRPTYPLRRAQGHDGSGKAALTPYIPPGGGMIDD